MEEKFYGGNRHACNGTLQHVRGRRSIRYFTACARRRLKSNFRACAKASLGQCTLQHVRKRRSKNILYSVCVRVARKMYFTACA